MSAAGTGFYALVFIALINTVISLYYYLLLVKAMFITPNDNPLPAFRSDISSRIGLVCCTAGVLLLGILSIVYQSIGSFGLGI